MQLHTKTTKYLRRLKAPYNPRSIADHDMNALRRSLREFGVVEPIVVNKRTRRIVGGHQRVEAAIAEGIDTLPVCYVDLDETEERQLNLALNRISGKWDEVALTDLLRDMQRRGAEMSITGFRSKELAKYIDAVPTADDLTQPKKPKRPTARPGDTWALGTHRVYCGDATDAASHTAVMAGEVKRVSLVITDPPYGVSYVGKTSDALTIENDRLSPEATEKLAQEALRCALDVAKAGASIYVSCPAGPLHERFQAALRVAGWEWHQTLIWRKDIFVMGRSDYHYQHEPILYGWKHGRHYFTDDRTKSTVLDFARPMTSPDHLTTKPVALWSELIDNSTRPGQMVLDPFLGSGTTVIACERLGRRCLGIEIDPGYVDVAVKRWQNETGGKATREKR